MNSRAQLAEATKILQRRINRRLMADGVTMTDPDLVWVGPDVKVGRDVELLPMTMLLGRRSVGDGAVIGPNTRITDSVVAEGATSTRASCSARRSARGQGRPGRLPEARRCPRGGLEGGTCVEIKNSVVGAGSKVPHLSYIGDTTIGRNVNVGAGSITCNYDGERQARTEIGDGAFIGSDTMLVAPVTIGEGAVTGAGSAIARDVPDGALASSGRSRGRLRAGPTNGADAGTEARDTARRSRIVPCLTASA